MVKIWVFAGGGEAEVRGLIPFLEKYVKNCLFDRKTPVIRKLGPRPGSKPPGYGKTGKSLIAEIKDRLKDSLSAGDQCDKILIIDDLDCRDESVWRGKFIHAADSVKDFADIEKFVGFAKPELEAWIIADWDHSVAKHSDFRKRQNAMKHWLSTVKNIPFDCPETFGVYDNERDTCDQKLSDAIIEASETEKPRYSKTEHTPVLLQEIVPQIVKDKCPLFCQLFNFITKISEVSEASEA
jgi:hypothetical protein